jgi:L-ascorbate metabolism protein UlaG (beta-lactamase superfamily)
MSVFGDRARGARLERMRASPRFAEGVFHNTRPVAPGLQKGTAWKTMGQFFFGGQRRTPPAPLPALDPRAAWSQPADGLRATWLGHSTVLLELDGLRILTDPVWGERASPSRVAGPKRFQPVPVTVAQLPPLDAVVISHDHYDHLDYPTILELAQGDVPFFTSLGVGAHLEAWGIPKGRIFELDWWERMEVPGRELAITAAPSQHFSGRGLASRNCTLWSSLVIESARHKVFFSGDTGLTPEYAEIGMRLGPFDLVMLEVGAFHPAWGEIHLGPDNAVAALQLLGGGSFLPVHWGTFNLAIHAWDQPAERLFELAPPGLLMPRLGEVIAPRTVEHVLPWWRALAEEPNQKSESEVEAPPMTPMTIEPID